MTSSSVNNSEQHALHTIPIGGEEPVHWAAAAGELQCWCHPLMTYDEDMQAWQVTHNAQDCREAMERQGYRDSSRPWVIIAGTVVPVDQQDLLPVY